MPKSRKKVKDGNRIITSIVPTKFRVGNRKSGVSAHTMSTSSLVAALEDKNKSKYRNSINAVLATRK